MGKLNSEQIEAFYGSVRDRYDDERKSAPYLYSYLTVSNVHEARIAQKAVDVYKRNGEMSSGAITQQKLSSPIQLLKWFAILFYFHVFDA